MNRSYSVPALAAVAIAASLVVGCASPPTPTSIAQAARAVPPAAPPTSATAGGQTIVAIQPPPAAPTPQRTLCGFLGLDKAAAGAGGLLRRAFSRIKTALGLEGRFPGLQPKPPVLPITDPANLDPSAPPAVQAAAEAKMEEDQSAQKIQALRYLAKIGCGGCYPGIEEAMLAALDDCTEEVRYEAVLALRGDGNTCCAYCRCQSCCSPAVRKKLDELANTRDDQGCYKEPSERVRRMARMVLAACGGLTTTETAPEEGPTPAPPPGEVPVTAKAVKGEQTLLMSPVQLVSFDDDPDLSSLHDSVLARVNGEEIYESRIVPLIETESARRRAQGIVVGPDQFQAILIEQVRRAIDAKLLLQQAHRDLTAAGRPFGPLSSEELNEWLQGALNVDPYVSLLELNAYYRSNLAKFQGPPEVRWEQITIWVKEAPSREKALAAAEFVRQRAAGKTELPAGVDLRSAETKIVEYKPLGKVEPRALVASLKSLPVGAPSSVIENGDELYVVRVLDRRAGPLTSFDEAVGVIRTEIMAERRRKAEQALLARLRPGAQVWTAFDVAATSSVPSPPPALPVVAARKLAPLPTTPPEVPVPPVAAPASPQTSAPRDLPVASTTSSRDSRRTSEGVQPQIIKFDFPSSEAVNTAPQQPPTVETAPSAVAAPIVVGPGITVGPALPGANVIPLPPVSAETSD